MIKILNQKKTNVKGQYKDFSSLRFSARVLLKIITVMLHPQNNSKGPPMRAYDFLKNIFLALILLQVAPPLIKNIVKNYYNFLEPKSRVAIIPLKGVLYDASDTIKQLHTYFKDPTIKAIVVKMDCSGSATGTGQSIYDEIMHLKVHNQKPIITLVENTCASGGYLIASATDYIVAPGMSLVGSIGVCLPYLFQMREFIEKHTITYIPMTAGAYKSTADPFTDLKPEQKTLLQSMLNDSYEQFITMIAHNRKLSTSTAKEWADGKIFTGKQALKLGLIDEIGAVSAAVKIIKEKAMIEGDIEWVKKEKPLSALASLFSGEQPDNDSSLLEGAIHTVCATLENRYSAAKL